MESIVSRTWTASGVLEAYIARAAQAHQATNCLTEGTYALPVTTSYKLMEVAFMCERRLCLDFTPARDACRTVVFFDEAREDARRLDADFAETGRLKGPLHGVPISLKDLCALKFRPRFPVSIPLFSFSLCGQHTQFGNGD